MREDNAERHDGAEQEGFEALIRQMADDLIGTAALTSISHEFEVRGIPETQENLQFADSLVFECESCGWWCSTDELNNDDDESVCDQCEDE